MLEERIKLIKSLAKNEISVSEALQKLKSGGDEVSSIELMLNHKSPVINGHVVYGSKILIGVTHLALLLEEEYRKNFQFPVVLKKFMLHERVILDAEEIIKLRLKIEDKQTHVQSDINDQRVWRSIASAQTSVAINGINPEKLPLIDWESNLTYKGSELYSIFNKNGIVYQDPLLTVERVTIENDFTYCEMFNDFEFPVTGALQVNPVFIDGAIISAFFGAFSTSENRNVYIPLFVSEIICFKATSNHCFSKSVLKKANDEIAIFDISIYDDNHEEVICLKGVSCKKIADPSSKSTKNVQEDIIEKSSVKSSNLDNAGDGSIKKVRDYLVDKITGLIPDNSLSENKLLKTNFMDLGIESEALIHLTEEIEEDLKVELYPTIFFEYQNVSELAAFFVEEFKEDIQSFLNKFSPESKIGFLVNEQVKEIEILEVKPTFIPNVESTETLKLEVKQEPRSNDIAIIGMAGRFSKSNNVDEFWKNIVDQSDMITEVPPSRWSVDKHYSSDKKAKDKSYCKEGSFINNIDKFDPLFFNISPREARMMDPQMRHLLENLYHTAENAGVVSQLRGSNTGMYVGVCFHDYQTESLLHNKEIDPFDGIGNALTMLANRPSFYFDLKGPSLTVDTACSSSLVALDLACKAIQNGSCEMAFVSGVNLLLSAWHYKYFSSIGALSESGRCHSFDSRADGYTPGEGIASVLLKPLDKALADGDPIHSVIKGSAVKHGGYTNSITAPSAKTQALVLKEAWNNANILPEQIGYIEAHGTGTKLGDPIEIEALKMAFGNTEHKGFCRIGSVKSNIGHTEGAAGISGILMATLCIKNKFIPAMPNFEGLNPYIKIKNSPFVINNENTNWQSDKPLIAGVSSFGFGGTYAHVVLEEAPAIDRIHSSSNREELIIISAKVKDSLIRNVQQILEFIELNENKDTCTLTNIAYSLLTGRESFSERLVIKVSSMEQLKRALSNYVKGDDSEVTSSSIEDSDYEDVLLTDIDLNTSQEKFMELWLGGAGIDIAQIRSSNEGKAQIISLPGYAFLKESYWYDLPAIKLEKKIKYALSPKQADIQEIFIFLSKHQVLVNEHLVKDTFVLPGVGTMELILEGVRTALPQYSDQLVVNNLLLLAPLVVSDHIKLSVVVEKGENQIKAELKITDSNKTLATCLIGTNTSSIKELISLDSIKSRSKFTMTHEEVYERFKAVEICYGESFRGISKLWCSENEVLGLVNLPETAATLEEGYLWNPFLMDAIIQCTSGLQTPNEALNFMLPHKFENVCWLKEQPKSCWVHVELIEIDRDRKSCFITLKAYNTQFELVFSIEKLTLKFADKLSLSDKINLDTDFLPGYTYAWKAIKELPCKVGFEQSREKGKGLWVYNNPDNLPLLKKRFQTRPEDMVFLYVGAENRVYENSYEVKSQQDDFLAFLELNGHFDEICWLAENNEIPQSLSKVQDQQELTTFSLLRFIKALAERNKEKKLVNLNLFTLNADTITEDNFLNPNLSAMKGLAKVLPKDISWLKVGLLDLDKNEWIQGNHTVLENIKKLEATKLCIDYAVRNKILFQYRKIALQNIPITVDPSTKIAIEGNYVIVGGMGGLGSKYCEWLVSKSNVNLFILGSSEMDIEKQKKLDTYKAKGSTAKYIQVDITLEKECRLAIEKLNLQVINELVFSVIRLDDKPILEMEEVCFNTAFSPKVMGSWSMYFATENIDVKNVLYFSSINADIASKTQSNYVAACVFENSFAEYWKFMKKSTVKVINWGFWEQTGIVAGKDQRELLEAVGIMGIDNKEGVRFLETALSTSYSKICIAKLSENLKDILQIISNETSIILDQVNKDETLRFINEGFPTLDYIQSKELFRDYVVLSIEGLFSKYRNGKVISILSFMNTQEVLPVYEALIRSAFELLVDEEYLVKINEDEFEVSTILNSPMKNRQESIKQDLLARGGEYLPYFELFDNCIKNFIDVVNGTTSHAEVLFPNGSMETVNKIYQGNRIMDFYNTLVSRITIDLLNLHAQRKNDGFVFKILEIGAGTGGTSKAVFELLKESRLNVEYHYTDISKSFINYGKRTFAQYDFIKYDILDIEKPSSFGEQYSNHFDLVIASNVIHATSSIFSSLQNIRGLLSKNGILVLNEMIENNPFNTFTFGLTKEWWKFQDKENRLPFSPVLSIPLWSKMLISAGYFNTAHYGLGEFLGQSESMQIMVAENSSILSLNFDKLPTPSHHEKNTVPQKNQEISDKKNVVVNYIKGIFSEVLQIPAQQISIVKSYDEYGVDSITGQELIERLKKDIPKLNSVILFECTNIEQLASFFLKEFPDFIMELGSLEEEVNYSSVLLNDDEKEVFKSVNKKIIFERLDSPELQKDSFFSDNEENEIAIIGMAGKYPQAENLDEFWENLKKGKNCIEEIPKDRWNIADHFDSDPKKETTSYSKWGGFIKDIDKFDAQFFKMSPFEAELTDPQIRLFLENAWILMENAGYTADSIGQNVGVFVGVMSSQYQLLGAEEMMKGNISLPNCGYWAIANRVSHFFDFHGPSIAIDTACSSSLTALHLACRSILDKECNSAIVGGVNLIIHPSRYIQYSQFNMLASNGECKTFDKDADGFVDGEGVGSVLLKQKKQAIADGDFIYGTIKGSVINSGGKSAGFTVPDIARQSELIAKNLKSSGVKPQEISYVEAHGTGTKLGDPIEVRALTKAFEQNQYKKQYCAIGSVKSNIGHLEAAAGVASLSKVLLQFYYKTLVPSINFREENPKIEFKETPFFVQQSCSPWNPINLDGRPLPRIATISSFGAGGSNANIIIEEYKNKELSESSTINHLIILSSDKDDLDDKVVELNRFLSNRSSLTHYSLKNIAGTLQLGRVHHRNRVCFNVSSLTQLQKALTEYSKGNKDSTDIFLQKNKTEQDDLALFEKPISNNNIKEIAEYWIKGGDVNWNELYSEQKYLKVHLPGQLFRKDRYWLKQVDPLIENVKITDNRAELWDSNHSDLEKFSFTKQFSGHENILKDHNVSGQMILPGVVYLEMFRQTMKAIYANDPVVKINNFILASPIVYHEQLGEIRVDIKPGKDRFDVEVSSESDGVNQLHAMGKLVLRSQVKEKPNVTLVDLNSIIARCPKVVQGKEVYELYSSVSLVYGKSFRGIQKINCGNLEALSFISIDGESSDAVTGFNHTILDGALQTIMGVNLRADDHKMFLPFSFKSFECYANLTRECYVHAKVLTEKYRNDDLIFCFDIDIFDVFGKHLARFNEFVVRAFDPKSVQSIITVPEEEKLNQIYIPKWHCDEAFRLNDMSSLSLSNSLIFCNSEDYLRPIKDRGDIITVVYGKEFLWKSKHEVIINPAEPADYSKLFSDLEQQDIKINQIIHLWNYLYVKDTIIEHDDLLNIGVRSLFLGYQAVLKHNKIKNIPFFYCYTTSSKNHYNQCANALAKSFTKESPKGKLMVVEFDHLYPLPDLLSTLHYEKNNVVKFNVKLEKGKRYLRHFERSVLSGKKYNELEKGNNIIIVGGHSGVGKLLAKHLIKQYQVNVFAIGRRTLNDTEISQLEIIRNHDSSVRYLSCDVNNRAELKVCLNNIRDYGGIHGIIHAAGIVEDHFLIQKKLESFNRVLLPKINGTINLDELTINDELKFFITFSSLAGVMGNVGQGDYAAANCFMDSYQHYRDVMHKQDQRNGKSISINWPYWKEGGMQLEAEYLAIMQKQGLEELTTSLGIAYFDNILNSNNLQSVVAIGNDDKIFAMLNGIESVDKNQLSDQKAEVNEKYSLERMIEIVTSCLAETLKISPDELDSQVNVVDFGMDSILMMRTLGKIESSLGIVIDPNLLVDNSTIHGISEFLLQNHQDELLMEQSELKDGFTENKSQKQVEVITEIKDGFPQKENFKEERDGKKEETSRVAVIGMACRFPGSDTTDEFWERLVNGVSSIGTIPKSRWEVNSESLSENEQQFGAFIDNYDAFDASHFNITDQEALVMDPQQRILLELSQELIDNAGYRKEELDGSKTGVFLGGTSSNYIGIHEGEITKELLKYSIVSNIQNMMAARISNFYNFKGYSGTIDTACSSSLVAIHQAVESIRDGKCEFAMAGGISLLLDDHAHKGFSGAEVLSKDGRVKVFDQSADGFTLGEGGGLVFLKDYEKAVRDGDQILAIIRGSAVNNDGRTMGVTTPNRDAQKEVIKAAINEANVNVENIGYLEAHGTGTLLGDPIEIQAATQVYREFVDKEGFCATGSVKTNVGHMLTAAGVCGFIKVVLSLNKGKIPPTLNCDNPHPRFKFDKSPFFPVTSLTNWTQSAGERLAAISSFGFGGTNCHMIVQDYLGNSVKRLPIKNRKFNRSRYCLGKEILPVAEYELLDIFAGLRKGDISIEEAEKLIKNLN
jgi:acyl transferase domain-containing protein/short-subunit dehydrogenase/acyl carrier protein/ubiquinone/menaquinone biosynthesis C-methylase UbiE